jgi:excinuclease ABC subunit C
VGPKRRKALLEHFQSVKNIREASLEELENVPNISNKLAKTIKEYLQQRSGTI